MTDSVSRTDTIDGFRFEYEPGVIRFGRECVDDLDTELERHDVEKALVVCGRTVGTTPAVIEPVEAGLGDRHAGTFAQTTPEKRLKTAYDVVDAMHDSGADGLVSLGGGSSIDTAKVASVLAATERSPEEVGNVLQETGSIPVPDRVLPPHVTVPTTLAGADLSMGGGINATPESGLVPRSVNSGVYGARVMPTALFYDPALFETTPLDVLAGSGMNGFNKGVENLYAQNGTPITDATAKHGLELLRDSLVHLRDESRGDAVLDRAIQGIILVQYGIWKPDGSGTLSILHAFGHGVTALTDAHQGNVHATVTPLVLRYLFDNVDARRYQLAHALGVSTDGSDEDVAERVVGAVTEVRDALDLPSRLRSLETVERHALPALAEAVHADWCMGNAPEGLDPSVEDIEEILEDGW